MDVDVKKEIVDVTTDVAADSAAVLACGSLSFCSAVAETVDSAAVVADAATVVAVATTPVC
ncbi:MAG: hypothetical protein RHS_0636 [Robinsoniella sp. RHS]|nr:MAG: hypothetical protein RHS_0636 [Robinsoniella sp. RHS]